MTGILRRSTAPTWLQRLSGCAVALLLGTSTAQVARAQDDAAAWGASADEDAGGDLFAGSDEQESWHDDLPLRVQVMAGFGMAMHANEVPAVQGIDRVESAVVPALHLGAAAEGPAGAGLAGGLRLQYRSTLSYDLTRSANLVAPQMTAARAQQFALEGLVRLDLGDDEDGLSVPIFVGASITDFATDVLLDVLEYGWLALQVRPSLRLTLLDESFRLTLGPTIGGIVYAAKGLQHAGIDRTGFVFGAEVELQVRVFEHLFVQAAYLEQRAQLAETDAERTLIDSFRTLTADVVVAY